MTIDILMTEERIACVDAVTQYMESKGWLVRVLQVSAEGLADDMEAYKGFIGDSGAADVVLTVNSPVWVYGAKKVHTALGKPCMVIAWLDGLTQGLEASESAEAVFLKLADAFFVTTGRLHEMLRTLFPESHIFDVFNPSIYLEHSGGDDCSCEKYVHYDSAKHALADFECKVREIAFNSDKLFRLREYGNLYCGDKISVIIPCYNVEKYVAECIESLLATAPTESQSEIFPNMEYIFVDDASKDGTVKILREYQQKHPDIIRLFECKENGGQSIARNIGLEHASGNYIGFVDSDDRVEKDIFRKLYEKAALYECQFSTCDCYVFDEAHDKVDAHYKFNEDFFSADTLQGRKNLIIKQGVCNESWLHIYKKSLIDENNIRFPEHLYMEDIYFYFLCILCAERSYVMSEPLYWYRWNWEATTKSDRIKTYYMDEFKSTEKTYQSADRLGLLDGVEEEFAYYYFINGVYAPVKNMLTHYRGIEMNADNINLMRDTLLEHFPDIAENPYIRLVNDDEWREVLKTLNLS